MNVDETMKKRVGKGSARAMNKSALKRVFKGEGNGSKRSHRRRTKRRQ